MIVVSNDPNLWPTISFFRGGSYVDAACLTIVVYDWALTIGREFELIWRQRWSLMTVLYLIVRYIGIPFTTVEIISSRISVTDVGCGIIYFVLDWMNITVYIMLGAIMIVRLHAMYQQSRKLLIFLVAIFLCIQITCIVLSGIQNRSVSGEEYILSGTHTCSYSSGGNSRFLVEMTWILGTAWEVLALALAVWISVKHFRELQRQSMGWAVGDCFAILMKTHLFYFASFVIVSGLQFGSFSPKIARLNLVSTEVFNGAVQIAEIIQQYVLGPHLILGLREYNANLVANSDEGTAMTSIAFQERVQITTGGGV